MKIKTVKRYELSLPEGSSVSVGRDLRVSLTYPQLQGLHSLTSELLGMGVVTNLPDKPSFLPTMTTDAVTLTRKGDLLGAIKAVRHDSNCTLMEAKRCVEAFCRADDIKVAYPKLD